MKRFVALITVTLLCACASAGEKQEVSNSLRIDELVEDIGWIDGTSDLVEIDEKLSSLLSLGGEPALCRGLKAAANPINPPLVVEDYLSRALGVCGDPNPIILRMGVGMNDNLKLCDRYQIEIDKLDGSMELDSKGHIGMALVEDVCGDDSSREFHVRHASAIIAQKALGVKAEHATQYVEHCVRSLLASETKDYAKLRHHLIMALRLFVDRGLGDDSHWKLVVEENEGPKRFGRSVNLLATLGRLKNAQGLEELDSELREELIRSLATLRDDLVQYAPEDRHRLKQGYIDLCSSLIESLRG